MKTLIALLVAAALTTGVSAASDSPDGLTSAERAEFTKLVHQRNELYNQLKIAGDMGDAGQTKWVQNQLDVVERRLTDVAVANDLQIPPRPVGRSPITMTAPRSSASSMTTTLPGSIAPTAKQRAAFNKLVMRRNKLHAQLTRLDDEASEMMKRGEKPFVIHAQQVSAQDELDLIELQLAIQATRYNMNVPPVPGRDPLPTGELARPDDAANRSLDKAFARGRERAIKKLADDTDVFLGSIDFNPFLND